MFLGYSKQPWATLSQKCETLKNANCVLILRHRAGDETDRYETHATIYRRCIDLALGGKQKPTHVTLRVPAPCGCRIGLLKQRPELHIRAVPYNDPYAA